ncbi:hypothetical protein CEXT_85391 [Caerostris extrusa]|uniref:Uncharacterized protein n=1 Tax=Caerostris extrusa TaxID=172846 RepID=A0AAV4Q6L5_CAEEX|nr:hypothetical protein CEXT_85391 [Caerostris extrusa]
MSKMSHVHQLKEFGLGQKHFLRDFVNPLVYSLSAVSNDLHVLLFCYLLHTFDCGCQSCSYWNHVDEGIGECAGTCWCRRDSLTAKRPDTLIPYPPSI